MITMAEDSVGHSSWQGMVLISLHRVFVRSVGEHRPADLGWDSPAAATAPAPKVDFDALVSLGHFPDLGDLYFWPSFP